MGSESGSISRNVNEPLNFALIKNNFNHSPAQTITIGSHFSGVCVLFANHDAEGAARDVVVVQAYMDVVNSILPRDKSHCISI